MLWWVPSMQSRVSKLVGTITTCSKQGKDACRCCLVTPLALGLVEGSDHLGTHFKGFILTRMLNQTQKWQWMALGMKNGPR